MVLKGKFTTYNEFFDLIKLITQMRMTVSILLLNGKAGKELFIAFEDGKLVDIYSNSEDTVLLDFNFSNGKVGQMNYIKGILFSFLIDFENVNFETVVRKKRRKLNIGGFEALFLDVVREFDEIGRFPENRKVTVESKKLTSPEKEEIILAGYLLEGYTLYQSLFSSGNVKDFFKAFNNLTEKGVLK
ncbi:hypothetical protein [Desulfurobacterium atlanticum]|uniref:Uncharacterized protein n=1 Tax=Desulfurobacterium atlanticum TaxID=240169 RepID=A0A238ZVU5_9BACT|nr:hypothetical protein [Desulfurobacterium atlanticum]SNR87018.1 hypothetical protein SAMN06265340_11227 [Desulfurobacterium atlanticum]